MATNKLQFDPQGFIVGIGRVESNTKQLHNDTQEILKLLLAQRNAGNNSLQDMTQTLDSIHTSLDRLPKNLNRGKTKEYSPRKSAGSGTTPNAPRLQRKTKEYAGNKPCSRPTTTDYKGAKTPAFDRPRNAAGRFTAKAEDAKFVDKLSNKLGDTFGKSLNVDDKNLDPLIDGFHEMKDALSPISGVLGFIRDKAEQRRERKHDKAVEDNLETIADNTGGGGGKGGKGGGFLGSMAGRMMGGLAGSALGGIGGMAVGALGGVGKMATKLGGKRLGILGTLLGAGSLAMDWGNLDHEGKSAGVGGLVGGAGGAWAGAATGAAIGSVVPVIGTAIGGVAGGLIGGWLGSEGGEVLGKTASPYIQSWTQSLTSANIPNKLLDIFTSGLSPLFKGAGKIWDTVKEKTSSALGVGTGGIVDRTVSGAKGIWNEVTGANNGANPVVSAAADYATKHANSSLTGLCAKYVNDALRAQGLKVQGDGVDSAPNLIKNNPGKFQSVAYNKDYVPQKGDVMSIPDDKINGARHMNTIGRKAGHVAIYNGVNWVSDGVQYKTRGNTAAANDNSYNAIMSGEVTPTIARMINPNGDGTSNGGTGVATGSRGGALKKGVGNTRYDSLIQASSARNGVDPAFMKAMMDVESSFNPNAHSPVGANGLIQMMPATFRQYAKGENRSAFNPADNIEVAARYTRHLQDKFHGNKTLMAAAYNSGEYRDNLKAGKIPNIPETQNHVKKVMARYEVYKGADEQETPQPIKLQAIATSKKGMTPASIPASKKEKIPKPPVVTQKISNDDDDDNKKSSWLSNMAIGGYITQNVSDRGIAHAVTGGLGEDRWWG